MELVETYYYYNNELADPRTNNWWLISSPLPLILILGSYIYFVLVCGPRYMQNVKPYNLNTFVMYYNIFQIVANIWLIYKIMTAGWLTHLTVGCEIIDYSLDPMAMKQAEATWWTMMLKLIDLSETAVFVLRKKDKQISFLHLYHHVSTLSLTWLSVKYFAGGMCTFPIMVNSTVHVIMYSYYFSFSRGTKIRRVISYIKPYITIIQMVQFIILLTHASQGLSSSCDVPTKAVAVYITNLFINLLLFINFYRQNYKSPKKSM